MIFKVKLSTFQMEAVAVVAAFSLMYAFLKFGVEFMFIKVTWISEEIKDTSELPMESLWHI